MDKSIQNDYSIWASSKDNITEEERIEKIKELYRNNNCKNNPVLTEPFKKSDFENENSNK